MRPSRSPWREVTVPTTTAKPCRRAPALATDPSPSPPSSSERVQAVPSADVHATAAVRSSVTLPTAVQEPNPSPGATRPSIDEDEPASSAGVDTRCHEPCRP